VGAHRRRWSMRTNLGFDRRPVARAAALALLSGLFGTAADAATATAAAPVVEATLEPLAGSAIRRGVATTTLAVPAERLFRAMADVDHWAEFMPFMVRSRPLGPREERVWEQDLALPFPLRDRIYAIRVQASHEGDQWTVVWHHVAGSGNVRGLQGRLDLRALGPSRTAVELSLWSDLGGLASVAAQEAMLQRSLGWILDGLRQQAGRCRYDRPVAPSCAEEPASTALTVVGEVPNRAPER
jgi:ribosome-associated toxin RatA of RatAB toxin-antitoxin module